MAVKKSKEQEPARFSVADLCASEVFRAHRDALSVALDHRDNYTVEEARILLDKFLKRKVK